MATVRKLVKALRRCAAWSDGRDDMVLLSFVGVFVPVFFSFLVRCPFRLGEMLHLWRGV